MNSAHGYTEGAEVPQQPQADKANEGREEKTETVEWSNLKYQVGNILVEKFLQYNDGKFHTALELNPATHALTEFFYDQLSKEREDNKNLSSLLNGLQNKFIKEREMRKQLVVVSGEMKKIYSKYAHDDPYEDHVFEYLESLIKIATELDKK